MDGIHDLGGMQGFGPIPIDHDERPFHAEWEGRMWAIASATAIDGVTIDWFRHGLERMVPSDYLDFAYFNKWCADIMMLMIDNGDFTLDEVIAGHTDDQNPPPPAESPLGIVAINRKKGINYETPAKSRPRFEIGDEVSTKPSMQAAHTRLPRYARNATGKVIAHHGAHVFPDDGALGIESAQHLYTVAFAAGALWPDAENPRDIVSLDLWESYFV